MSSTRTITAGVIGLATALLGCSSDATGPAGGATIARILSMQELDSALGTGPTRVEIRLEPGSLTAREVEVETTDDEEKLVSRVTAMDPAQGTVTLELGGLVVGYGSGTRFRTPGDSRVSRAAWENAIQGALDAGQQPPIEARRRPAGVQDPVDPTFNADDLRLASRDDGPKLEIYVDGNNLTPAASPPPLAILRVLDLPIEITTGTRLGAATPGGGFPTGTVEFEARVVSVDVAGGTFTLAGGTVVRVNGVAFEPLGDLFSLQAMEGAVAGNSPVRAEGRGTVETAGPPAVIAAQSLKVEVDD